MPKFTSGQLVRLHSGGPRMTINTVIIAADGDISYGCVWFSEPDFRAQIFHEASLHVCNDPLDRVLSELARAKTKFPRWPTDPLHAVAIVGEEFGELVKAVLQTTYEPPKSSHIDVREEAIQCAAMALRFVESLDAYRYQPAAQHRDDE